jgi:hypothetical protein
LVVEWIVDLLVEAFMPLFFCGCRFSIFILVVTGFYYLYVILGYYRAEAFGWLMRKGYKKKEGERAVKGDDNIESGCEPEPKAKASLPQLFDKERSGTGGDEQFQQMQQAIAVIRQVITQGIENKLDRENLLDHVREVLGDYRKLRKTEYAETINNFLIRVFSSELSLELGERELAGLWK